MRSFLCADCNFRYFNVLLQLFLLSTISKNVISKCTVNKQEVTCFGSTWKQDLLPIENNSLMKLYISKCTDSRVEPETLDINFLRNVSRLKLLSITNCALARLPLVDYEISSIEILDLSNNQINVNAQFPDSLKRFPNLKIIDLSNNRLTHLPKSWFNCPNQLEIVILNGNLIGGFNPTLASCFIHLQSLSLRGNRFVRLRMPSYTRKSSTVAQGKERNGLRLFAEQGALIGRDYKNGDPKDDKTSRNRHDYFGVIPQFKSLKILDLSHNKIKTIDQIPLSKLENLDRLNLSYNQLSGKLAPAEGECDFGTAPFYINGKFGLSDLDLSSNKGLTRIHNCWTFGLQNLKILRIRNCSLSSIFDSSFEKMKSLTWLDLSENRFSSVPKELMVVSKSLKWLSLAYNNVSQITSFYLSAMVNLRTLNLSHNQFQNLMTFPSPESEGRQSENIGTDFLYQSRDSNSEEPVNMLSQMKQLHELDLSFNDLTKLSALSDLSPSIKSEGELQKIDLRGNPFLAHFTDFNAHDITTFLTEFHLDTDQKMHCDCLLVGFIKWITQRHLDVSGRCTSPGHLSRLSITQPQVLTSIVNDPSCKEVSPSTISIKAPYRLKLSSNANLSLDSSQFDNDPMDDGQRKSTNQKRQVDYQKWVMSGSELTLFCHFYSIYLIDGSITIEWQRLKQKPIDNRLTNQQSGNFFLKDDKPEQWDTIKYREKIEHLSSNYDPRIKISQIGPLEDDEGKNTPPKRKETSYKYVGSLLLKPVFPNDIGRYRCLINGLPTTSLYGQNQLISKEENIKVFTPPRFTSIPSNPMAILEGETAEITCRAIGNPTPMTSLGRIGSKDFPAARGRRMKMYKDDSSFFITNVSQVDSGNYSCTSRNAAGTISHNFTLKVQMPATIVNKVPSEQTVRIGEALIIGFKMNGVPLPKVQWFKDDQKIVENDRIRFSSDHLMLVIQSTVVTDAGLYKISVLNALGGNDAFVSVAILDSHGRLNHGSAPIVTDSSQNQNSGDKDSSRMPDYWLSGIIIIIILSILVTSILWITIFFCFNKIIGSKKRRLLLISNSQSRRTSFDKTLNTAMTTTSFSNARMSALPLIKSLTSSTIVPRDLSQENIDTFTDKTVSDYVQSSQLFCQYGPLDVTNKVGEYEYSRGGTDPCDSGIDSSQVYSETMTSGEGVAPPPVSLVYQCRHKGKHKSMANVTVNNGHYGRQPRKRYACSNDSGGEVVIRSRKEEDHSDSGERGKQQKNRCADGAEDTEGRLRIDIGPACDHVATRHCNTPLITDHSQHPSLS